MGNLMGYREYEYDLTGYPIKEKIMMKRVNYRAISSTDLTLMEIGFGERVMMHLVSC